MAYQKVEYFDLNMNAKYESTGELGVKINFF